MTSTEGYHFLTKALIRALHLNSTKKSRVLYSTITSAFTGILR